MKTKCSKCNGDGYTAEHDSGDYSHDANWNCLGYCPVQVQCEHCQGTGFVSEGTMKIEMQVCSLELAKKLKELNCPQESLFYWVEIIEEPKHSEIIFELDKSVFPNGKFYSAFTCAELGEMLPKGCFTYQFENWHTGKFDELRNIKTFEGADTEADARAKLLIFLLENKLVKVEDTK